MQNPTPAPLEIFSTGVRLQAVECTINGQKQFRWLAASFEDDSYQNGNLIIPVEFADTPSNLITKD